MPYDWVDAELFHATPSGVNVYHVYMRDIKLNARLYHYAVTARGCDGGGDAGEFNIRKLPEWTRGSTLDGSAEQVAHFKRILDAAAAAGHLPDPADFE